MNLPLIDNTFFIDNSTLEYYTACRRSFQYYALQKRQLSSERQALNFGTSIHAGLDARYKDASLDEQLTAIRDFFSTLPPNLDPEEHRTCEFAEQLHNNYHKEYPFEPFTVLKDDEGKPMVEISFAVPFDTINDIQVVYMGRIDLVSYWDGQLYPVDHKTTSILGSRFFDEFINSSQLIGYCWAFQRLSQKQVDGYMVNAINTAKPVIKVTPKTAPRFARQKFQLEQERIAEWYDNTHTIISDIIRDVERGEFPMETRWCVGKYGRCPYLDACSLPPISRPGLLSSSLYKDVTWSPLNHYQPK